MEFEARQPEGSEAGLKTDRAAVDDYKALAEAVHEEGLEEALENGLAETLQGQELNKDYRSFLRLLHEHKIPYCMDSGVLLGLMRDGKLFDHEKDIDLQMWAEHEARLRALLPVFWEAGYTVTIWLYKDLVYQYRFLKEGELPVHLMIFRRAGDQAWCPAGKAIGPPRPRRVSRRFFGYFVRARKHLRERLVATDVAAHPWKYRRLLGTWWIPGHFFENVIYHHQFETYLPQRWEAYLAYRYGEWRYPKRKWDFWRRDGALKQARPEELADLSLYQNSSNGKNLKELRKEIRGKL